MVAIHPEIDQSEVDALCDLFHALDGPRWTENHGWMQFTKAQQEKSGHGLAWHGTKWTKGHVISIDLRGNNLQGSLPDVFARLKKLQFVDLGGNPSVTGRVPLSLMKLKHLQYCYLDGTQVFNIVSSRDAHDFQITKYISSSKAAVRLRIGKSTWVADVTEQEMYLVSTRLQAARAPPRPTGIKMTAHNATGPERVRAARKLQRIFRGSRARRKLLNIGKSLALGEISKPDENLNLLNNTAGLGDTTLLIRKELVRRYGNEGTISTRYRRLFSEYDHDRSGFVHSNDVLLLCGDLGIPVSPKQFESTMEAMNTTTQGKVPFEVLQDWLENLNHQFQIGC